MSLEHGLYTPRDTILHSLDPRAKIAWAFIMTALCAVYNNPNYLAFVYMLVVVTGLVSRMTLKRYALVIFNSLVFLIASLVMWGLRISAMGLGEPLFTIPLLGWAFTDLGFLYAVANCFRIVIPVTAFLILFTVTKPPDLTQGLARMRLPYRFGFIFTLALQYVPTMFRETKQIMEAQMSRGLELQGGNIIMRARGYVPIFIPLMVRMMKMTIQLSMSMESRCFGARKERTYLVKIKFQKRDYAFSLFWVALLTVASGLRLIGYGVLPVPFV